MRAWQILLIYILLRCAVGYHEWLDDGYWLWAHELLASLGWICGLPVLSLCVEEWLGGECAA